MLLEAFFPPTKSGLSCANLPCLSILNFARSNSQSSPSLKLVVFWISIVQKIMSFWCANYAAVSFWSMAELMMRSFRIQKGLSLFSVEHHYLPTRNLKTILALNCVKFSAVWENFFASCAERRGATIGALRGQSRVHFLCVARWMFTFSHSIYRQKLHKNFSRWIFANL